MKKIKFIGMLLLAVSIFAGCKKDVSLPEAPRLFRPVLTKDGLQAPSNYIEAKWQVVKDASSYTIQLSTDTFKTIDVTLKLDTNYALFENLKYDQLYQVQVKANAADSSKNSKYSFLGAIKTPKFPSILNSPTINDFSDAAVKVSWQTSGAAVTSIKVYQADKTTLVKQVTLTATDVTNGYRIVSGLQGSTTYYIELYSDTKLRGYDVYTTKAPLSGILVDLREIVGRPDVLLDTLPVVPSGSTIILKRGQTYNMSSTYAVDKTLTFVSGNDLLNPNQAVINLASNLDLASGATVDSLVFRNVKLTSTDGYSSKYVMNISQAGTLGTFRLDACTASQFRGLLRIKTGGVTINTFEINNSVIDSISNYGVANVDNAGAKINDFVFKNSTFAKVEKFITSKNAANSILIESCTFNEAPFGGNYLIDFSSSSANTITQGIKLYNTIFGVGYSNNGNITVRGYRAAASVNVDASNTFTLSDYTGTSPFANVIPYTRPSTDVFTDPSAFNFKIKDNSFPGRSSAGDPRWRL